MAADAAAAMVRSACASSGDPPGRRLRLLCLHSWRTSAAIFREQFERARLIPEIEDLVDMVFVDAPNPAIGKAPRDVREAFPDRPYYEWFTTQGGEEDLRDFVLTYEGLQVSEAYLERVIREQGPFDGLCGFSQGAVMASTLAALQRAGMALQGVPPFKCVVLFGAAFSEHPRHLEAFEKNGRVDIPSLHVIGHRDFVKRHSFHLVRQFNSPIVIFHPRGHVIPPLQGPHLAVLRAFLSSLLVGGAQPAAGVAAVAPRSRL